jgi:ABC-2 type transport system ATP-binding protein
VAPGGLVGLVGPSGCGKTTLIRLVAGLLGPTEGRVAVRGSEPANFSAAQRQDLGYMPQQFSLFPALSIRQNCEFVAGLYGIGWWARRRRIRDILAFLDLWDARGRRAAHASGGMRRRLSLACALLHQPRLILVDEPTAGLDPELRLRIWDHLRAIRSQGITVVVTTQLIEEAERCDAVGIMRDGRLVAYGSPDDLRERARLPEIVEIEADQLDGTDIAAIWALPGVRNARLISATRIHVEVTDSKSAMPGLASALHERGRALRRVDTRESSFEDVFLEFVGTPRR